MTFYVVLDEQSDPWYSPSFGGIFDDLGKAKAYAEYGNTSEYDRDNGTEFDFRWVEVRPGYLTLVECEDGECTETGTFIKEASVNPTW